jgi:hypothetical protein
MTSSTIDAKIDMLLRLRLGFTLNMKLPRVGIQVSRPAGTKLLTTKSTAEIPITDGLFTVGLQMEVPDADPVGALLTEVLKETKPPVPILACGLEGFGTTIINRVLEGFCYNVRFLSRSFFGVFSGGFLSAFRSFFRRVFSEGFFGVFFRSFFFGVFFRSFFSDFSHPLSGP